MIRFALFALCVTLAAGVPHVPRLSSKLPRLPKIVGGVEAAPGEFPWQISLQHPGLFGTSHSCGGSVISENYIITACHCLNNRDPSKTIIVAGEWNLKEDSGTEQVIEAVELIKHEHCDGNTFTNDVGLVRLNTSLVFDEFTQPIDLPAQMELVPAGTNCTTTGWGTTVQGGTIPDILRKVSVPVVSDADCRQSYGITDVADHMLCAGLPEGGKDSCQGDSGGPFVCDGKLHGITSWGYGCAQPNYPGVYVEVAYFRDWIDSHAV